MKEPPWFFHSEHWWIKKKDILLLCGGFDLFETLFYIQIVIWVLCKSSLQTSRSTSVWKKRKIQVFRTHILKCLNFFSPKLFFWDIFEDAQKVSRLFILKHSLVKMHSHSFKLLCILEFSVLEDIHRSFLFCAVSNL